MKMRASLVLLAGAVLLAPAAQARTWHVFPDGSGDAPTIQAGIDSASVGDTVVIACGTYHEFNVRMKNGICLRGESPDSACAVIDAEADGRVLICDSLTGTTRIEGLRMIRGVNPTSGADRDGAGLYCRHSSPLITGCVFDDNDCSGVDGGGMVATGESAPVLTRCVFSNNTAGNYGGGLYCVDSSAAVVLECEFIANVASWWGGGLACERFSDAVVTDCVFRENTTNHWGGGIAAISRAMPIVTNCLFLGNWAGSYGGAIATHRSALATIVSSTFYGNESPSGSAVAARDTAQVHLDRCIVACGNSKPVLLFNMPAFVWLTCSDVYGNIGGDWVGAIIGQDTLDGNLWVDPEFCGAVHEDFTLSSTSPCLSAACGAMGAFGEGCAHPPRNLWHVRSDGTGDAPTIQAALDSADHGDTLVLADGIFSGPGNRDLDPHGRAITVYSEGGDPEACVIDCGGSQSEPHTGFRFVADHMRPGSLAGVTIRNAYGTGYGGAVFAENYSFSVSHCVFEGSHAVRGGGMYSKGASLTMSDTRFVANVASLGGGMYSESVSLTTSNTRFIANDASQGSALDALYGSLVVTDCAFTGNGSETSGEAIHLFVGGQGPTFTRCSIEGNTGGGIFHTGSSRLVLDECSIVDNHSPYMGGGARVEYFNAPGEASIFRNCLFSGNSALQGGAISGWFLYMDDVQGSNCLTLDSCTVVANYSTSGAGIWYQAEYAWMEIRNTILAFNWGSSAVVASGYHYACPFVSCTDIYGNSGGNWTGCLAPLLGTSGNISADPVFCDTASGDFTLDAVSPCLNAPSCGQIGAFGQGCDVVTGVASGDAAAPARAFLAANRPNPFNPTTSVRFGIPKPAIVTLSVLDVTGREVAVLANGPSRVGEFVATWDGTDGSGRPVGSGIYFFRLEAGDFEAVRKAILIR